MATMGAIKAIRVYEEEEGFRVLVDRLWPRGISKKSLRLDLWAKELAPSSGLRTWFGHDDSRFAVFARRYRKELDGNPAAARFVKELAARPERTDTLLLYAARSPTCNHAVVLCDWLKRRLKDECPPRSDSRVVTADGKARGHGGAENRPVTKCCDSNRRPRRVLR